MSIFSAAVRLDCEVTSESFGSTHIVRCGDFEGIWSSTEPGTFLECCQEHLAHHERQARQREHAREVAWARRVYRTTSPGDPARRGLNAYADYLG